MTKAIQQLIDDVNNSDVSVSSILRKAKVIATRLDLTDFLSWIDKELNGYDGIEEKKLPAYRKFRGELQACDEYRSWIPVIFTKEPRMNEIVSFFPMRDNIAALERNLIEQQSTKSGQGMLIAVLSADQKRLLNEVTKNNTDYRLELPDSCVNKTVEAVRNLILDWALKLEKEGITGEGMNISSEKEKAQRVTNNHFHGPANIGHIGDVNDQATSTIDFSNKNGGGILGKIGRFIVKIIDWLVTFFA